MYKLITTNAQLGLAYGQVYAYTLFHKKDHFFQNT